MMNREEALKWLVENINEGWPGHLHVANYSDWLLTSYTNMKYMVSFAYTKDGENPIKIDDWKEAKRMQMTSREDAIKWAVENLNEWPLSFYGSLPCKDWRWVTDGKSGEQRMQSEDYLFEEITEQDWQAARPAPASNKPSWDDAPDGAKWLCQDADGTWMFSGSDIAPIKARSSWSNHLVGDWLAPSWKDAPNPTWRDTLENRPDTDDSTPIDMRQVSGIDAGEALDKEITITPDQVAEIVGDALTAGKESDPSGISSSTPGAKLDAGKIRPDLILSGMPRALLAVSEVGTFGAAKYSENGWLAVPDGIKRYTAAMDRHRLKEGIELLDTDSELRHAAHLAWNALARLELMLRD